MFSVSLYFYVCVFGLIQFLLGENMSNNLNTELAEEVGRGAGKLFWSLVSGATGFVAGFMLSPCTLQFLRFHSAKNKK